MRHTKCGTSIRGHIGNTQRGAIKTAISSLHFAKPVTCQRLAMRRVLVWLSSQIASNFLIHTALLVQSVQRLSSERFSFLGHQPTRNLAAHLSQSTEGGRRP